MTSRVRERGAFSYVTQTYVATRANGTIYSTETQSNIGLLKTGEFQSTTDVVTPNYRTRIARGDIVNNPFLSTTLKFSPSFSGVSITNTTATGTMIKYYDWSHLYGLPGYSFSNWVDINAEQREVSTEVAAKVASTNVDGAIEALEARQTMELFDRHQYSLRKQIQKELKYAEKRGFRFPVNVPVAVMANNWLKYRYGLGPAISLMHDAIVVGTKIQTRRETARDGTVAGGSSTDAFSVTGGMLKTDYKVTRTWESSIRAGILYEYINFRNKYGFSIDQVPYALWNIVPYSFVSDWFWNMGTFIRALTPKAGIRQLATWMGYETKISHLIALDQWSKTMSNPSYYSVTKPPGGFTTIEWVGRHRVPFIRSPSLYVRENAISEIVTSKRIVDAFALTSQMFFRLMRAS